MEWPSGEATVCKTVHTGSIPVSTSLLCAFSSAGERFPDTEEVTGSIPVSRTRRNPLDIQGVSSYPGAGAALDRRATVRRPRWSDGVLDRLSANGEAEIPGADDRDRR